MTPNVTLLTASAARRLATAVLLPHDHDGSPLPVLLDPYGGPHAQRVVRRAQRLPHVAVVRRPGLRRGRRRRAGHAGPRARRGSAPCTSTSPTAVLDDQVDALHAARRRPARSTSAAVAIRGWSFGGYLAALAVLRRPDVFHAAVAGAPVTEWRLYDTHYTERYLGDPSVDDRRLRGAPRCSRWPPTLTRPLLLIHGLADDNVVAAHTLQLSSALLAAGRPHEVLPLVGVTHMTPQEVVAENLLLHQLDFLRRSLGSLRCRRSGRGARRSGAARRAARARRPARTPRREPAR